MRVARHGLDRQELEELLEKLRMKKASSRLGGKMPFTGQDRMSLELLEGIMDLLEMAREEGYQRARSELKAEYLAKYEEHLKKLLHDSYLHEPTIQLVI